MYRLKFRVNLISDSQSLDAHQTKTTYIPISPLGASPSLVKKHGDIFTLYGHQATYLKNLIEAGQTSIFEIYTDPVIDALPVLTTDNLEVSSISCHVYGTVVSGGDSITEYGFVYAASTDSPTISNNKYVVGTGPFTGSYDYNFFFYEDVDGIPLTSGVNSVWFAAYAENSTGVGYGNILQTDPNPWICLSEGTLVSILGGEQKNIEDITYEDQLLCWDFDNAELAHAKPVWIIEPFKAPRYSLVKFSDGSELKTIDDGKGHSIFNFEKGMFTNMMSENTPLNTTTYVEDGSKIKVVGKEVIHEETMFYNVITNFHMNMFANKILTSTRLNNLYKIDGMQFVKTDITHKNRENFSEISDELFVGLRLSEQKDDVRAKVARLQMRQKPRNFRDNELN